MEPLCKYDVRCPWSRPVGPAIVATGLRTWVALPLLRTATACMVHRSTKCDPPPASGYRCSNQSLSGLRRLKREAKSCCVLTADDLEQWSLPRSPGLTKKRIFRSRATAAPRPGGCPLPTSCQCLRRSGLSAAIGHCALLWSGRLQL